MDLDQAPRFWRRFVVTPGPDRVTAAVEDDWHCMAVTLHHAGGVIARVEPVMDRAPWTTCPGAPAVLAATFTGVALAEVAKRGMKQANCTHLHDLALLAAAHAGDTRPSTFDLLASDPVEGAVVAELRRDGVQMVRIEHCNDMVTVPAEIAGVSLFKLRDWIASLPDPQREAARLLQWGTIMAHGRTTPMERQSDATKMPPNCYTFQPERAAVALRNGRIADFNAGVVPLAHFDGERFCASPE
jgi:hypothetical protein